MIDVRARAVTCGRRVIQLLCFAQRLLMEVDRLFVAMHPDRPTQVRECLHLHPSVAVLARPCDGLPEVISPAIEVSVSHASMASEQVQLRKLEEG